MVELRFGSSVAAASKPEQQGPNAAGVAAQAPKRVKADLVSHLWAQVGADARAGKEYAAEVRPTMTCGWLSFKQQVSMEQLQHEVRTKLLSRVHRLHAVPVEHEGWTYWEDIGVENVDFSYHFQHEKGFSSEAEWQAFLERTVTTPLDYSKPQWRYILVDRTPDGLCSVVSVGDHAMADGASGVASLLTMCEVPAVNPVFQRKAKQEADAEGAPKEVKARKLTAYERAYSFLEAALGPVTEGIQQDPDNRLKQPKRPLASKWHFATTPAGQGLDVAKFKEIKDLVPGSTVNDVMLAVTALSVREYYKSIADPIMGTRSDIHGTMAVNDRPSGADYLADDMFGNHIVAASTRYPMHESRVQTLLSFRDASRRRKNSPDTAVRRMMLGLASKVPREQLIPMVQSNALKSSIMISNVLFSLEPLKIFGQELEDVRFIACTNLGYYCGAATYKGKVSFGCVTTEEVKTDPKLLLPFIESEFHKLHAEVLHLHKGDPAFFRNQDRPLRMSTRTAIVIVLLVAVVAARLFVL